MDAAELRAVADRMAAELAHAGRALDDELAALTVAEARVVELSEAQRVILAVSQAVQQKAHGRVAGIVGQCLRAVFDDPYQFDIVFERKRGRTEARLVFKRRGHEVDPTEEGGGGVVDVAAFALRVACLVLTRPAIRPCLILDEPFKHLNGAEYQERAAAILHALAEEMNIQIILAADDDWLKNTGKVIEL
jgi:hypothetical protein